MVLIAGVAQAASQPERTASTASQADSASDAAAAVAAPSPRTTASLTFGGQFVGEADFDDSPGDLSITRLSANLGVRHTLTDHAALRFGFGIEHSHYDFSNATGLIAGTDDPFDDVLIARLSAGADFKIDDTHAWFVSGSATSSGEGSADFDDTITASGMVGYTHTFGDKLTLGAAVIVSTRLEDDVLVIPVPIVRWKLADQWTLATGEGANVRLTYQPTQAWAFGAEGGWERREFRLDDDGPQPSGIALDSRIPIGVFARFTPNRNIVIAGRVGAHVGSNIEISNSRGRKISDDDLDAAIYGGLDLTLRF
jgi:hypothetical protein